MSAIFSRRMSVRKVSGAMRCPRALGLISLPRMHCRHVVAQSYGNHTVTRLHRGANYCTTMSNFDDVSYRTVRTINQRRLECELTAFAASSDHQTLELQLTISDFLIGFYTTEKKTENIYATYQQHKSFRNVCIFIDLSLYIQVNIFDVSH